MVHYFKIVYIKELKELEPIPHLWEEGGVCWFPLKKREIKQYQCDSSKMPDKNWPSYRCEVKVTGISSWEHANNTANTLCNELTSTSEDDDEPPTIKRVKKRPTLYDEYSVYEIKKGKTTAQISGSLDDPDNIPQPEFISTGLTEGLTLGLTEVQAEILALQKDKNHEKTDDHDVTLTCNNNDTLILASSSEVKDVKNAVEGYVSEIDNLKNTIINELKSYLDDKFSSMSLELQNINNILKKDGVVSLNEENPECNFFPLATIEEVRLFEDKLNSDEYQKKVITNLRKIIGTGYLWRQASYRLASIMFTKELLTHYSWTGVSRTSTTKETFNKLNNILGVFYHVVRYSDNSFTYCQRELFFRDGILKHSQSRLKPAKKKNKENLPNNQQQEENFQNLEVTSDNEQTLQEEVNQETSSDSLVEVLVETDF